MAADLATLIERVTSQTRDSGGSLITPEDIVVWINEAQTDLASRTEVLQHEVAGTVSPTGTIPMPPGTEPEMVQVLSLRLGDLGDDVEFVTSNSWNAWSDDTQVPDRTIGRVFDKVIELFPTPGLNTTYVLRYSKIPYELVQGDDVHELPLQLERKLVEYAVAQAKYKDADDEAGDRWLFRYEMGLPDVNIGTRLNFPGPLQLTPEPGPFELDQGYSV